MISVAIVDDGVNEGLYNTGNLKYNIEITPELNILERSGYDRYSCSHGTTCAAIIKKYCPDGDIGSVKVLNSSGRAVRDQLIAALFWCVENGIKLVNLSLGTINFRDYEAVRKAVNYATSKGVIIISACNNKNIYTYPASLSSVIGVKCAIQDTLNEGQYRYNHYPLDGIDITACASHLLIKHDGSKKITSSCNSFAAPMIAAAAYNILQQNSYISIEQMKYKLAQDSVNPLPENWHANLYQRLDWIESALIFNCGCSKKVDIPYSFTTKKIVDIECNNSSELIEGVLEYIRENKSAVKKADTVIVNSYETTGTSDKSGFLELAGILYGMGKTLTLLDDNLSNPDIYCPVMGKGIKVFHPPVYKDMPVCEKVNIDVPVIALYDFSGTEFLNCLYRLNRIFIENGYNALAVSSTHRGLTAGIEYFPCMENVQWDRPQDTSLEHLYRIYNPDIIFLGIDASCKEPDYFSRLESKYEIDIRIIISNNKNQCIEHILDLNSESKNILLITDNKQKYPGVRTVDISDKSYPEILYSNIIGLFEEEGKLMDKDKSQVLTTK